MTPEVIERVLAEFRSWLQQLAAAPSPEPSDTEPIDLHTLLGTMLALKHEVNLQTRATRSQMDQNAEIVRHVSTALTALKQNESAQDESVLRPLLKAIIDTYDALALARREVARAQDTVLPLLAQLQDENEPIPDLPPNPPALTAPRPGVWERLVSGRSAHEQYLAVGRLMSEQLTEHRQTLARLRQRCVAGEERLQQTAEAAQQLRLIFDSIIAGYTMSLQRLDRLLREQDLQPIATVGEMFDPEQMEVLEAVSGTGRPSGEVLDEVRRGYRWRGRVFRYAQVRVARS